VRVRDGSRLEEKSLLTFAGEERITISRLFSRCTRLFVGFARVIVGAVFEVDDGEIEAGVPEPAVLVRANRR